MARFLGLRGVRLTSAISAICGLCFMYAHVLYMSNKRCANILTGAMATRKV